MQTEQSEQIGDLVTALAGVQQKMRPAIKDATNPHLKSKYADLAAVNAAAQPELGKAGLAVMQTAEEGADGSTFIATTLAHTSGQWIRGRLRVEVQPSKGLNLAQSQGLALTYARRYSLAAILGIVTEDDDGHGAGDPGQPRQQRQTSTAPAQSNGTDPAHAEDGKVCLQFKGERTGDWKEALKNAGFEWDAEKHSYRAPATEKSIAFAHDCVRDCGDQLRWHRIPETEAA